MRTVLLLLGSLLPLLAQGPCLNVWEQGVLIRQGDSSTPRGARLWKEGPQGTLGFLDGPAAFRRPSGELQHLAHLDGQTYAWGRVFVAYAPPGGASWADPAKAFRQMERSERVAGRQALYRSRDFRTWERIALAGGLEQELVAVHPLRDGSFLGVSGTELRGGGTAARFRISAEGVLMQDGPPFPWSPSGNSGSDGRRRFWTLFQGPDSLLLQTSGSAMALDLKDATLLWRLVRKDQPLTSPWNSLPSHQQVGPHGRLVQVARPRKVSGDDLPQLGRGSSLLMSSHMESRPMSPATRLVAQALRNRLWLAGGLYQARNELHTLDLRTGTWAPVPPQEHQIKVATTWLDRLVMVSRLYADPLNDRFNYKLSFRGDGTLELQPTRTFAGFWSQL